MPDDSRKQLREPLAGFTVDEPFTQPPTGKIDSLKIQKKVSDKKIHRPAPLRNTMVEDSKIIAMQARSKSGIFQRSTTKMSSSFSKTEAEENVVPRVMPSPGQQNRIRLAYRTDKDTTRMIERLERRVNSLIAEKSELASQIRHSSQLQNNRRPAAPAREIVIVKQPAIRDRTSRAFWERRYLSRFHLKILR